MSQSCPNPEKCGSCGWSHIPYEKQLAQKLSEINGSFRIKELDLECKKILPSPKVAHYRNRMDFTINFEGKVGLREKGKWWSVIDNHTCFISTEEIERVFKPTREWVRNADISFYDRKAHTGLLRYAVIRSTSLGQTMLTIVSSAPGSEAEIAQLNGKLRELSECCGATTVLLAINNTDSDVSHGGELEIISGRGTIMEEINGFRYEISPNAFFQTNSFAAPLLMKSALDAIPELSEKVVLDLYCGSGFFTIPMATKAKRCIGVEIIEDAIHDANRNAGLNGSKAEFICAKSEEYAWKDLGADVVLVDPPRSGMHDKALKTLLDTAPQEIVYVSCNPKNFAREMVLLREKYLVESMVAIDMFPHTPHVELVSKLVRK